MLGFKFQQCPLYSYKNLNELQKQLYYDKIGDTQIDKEQQIIEYFIDRSRCLRLYDLIYSIKVNFIKFHLGQLLELFKAMLEKVVEIEKLGLQHNYLDQTRIWINLNKNSPPLNITYQEIQYKINFTGYQCKLYEINLDESLQASEKIQIIISNILRDFEASKITCTNDQGKLKEIINQIYKPIVQQCQKCKINETITKINNLLTQYQFQKKSQTISFDDNYYTSSLSSFRMDNVEDELNCCIQNYGQYGAELESILLLKIKSISQNRQKKLNSQNDNQEIINFLDRKDKTTEEINKELILFVEALSNYSIENYLKEFKFEISPTERQIIYDSIQNRVKKQKLFKYFENFPTLLVENSQAFQDNFRLIYQNLIKEIADEEVKLYIELLILILIDELI